MPISSRTILVAMLTVGCLGAMSSQVLAQQTLALKSGEYTCKVSKEYKMRECSVSIDSKGVATLSIPTGLVAISGEVHLVDGEKNKAYFYGALTEKRPFGCYSCNESCAANPETCACKELPAEVGKTCAAQRVGFTLTKKGNTWTGTMPLQNYRGVYEEGEMVGHTIEVMMLEVVIKPEPAKKPAAE